MHQGILFITNYSHQLPNSKTQCTGLGTVLEKSLILLKIKVLSLTKRC